VEDPQVVHLAALDDLEWTFFLHTLPHPIETYAL
jgi:hypothetical protein